MRTTLSSVPERHLGRGISDQSGSVALTSYMPGERLEQHEHATPHLCLMLSGKYAQTSLNDEHVLRAGDLAIYPAGHRHSNAVGDCGAACLNLHVPDQFGPNEFRIARPGVQLRLQASELATAVAIGDPLDPLGVDCLVAELLARDDPPERTSGFPLQKFLDLLEEHPASNLLQLSEYIGRHPTHLARAFRQATGLSIGAYRRRSRVRSLCVDLRTEDATLCELAVRHGYSDQAHMTREFKSLTGHSPGAWRTRR